MGYILSARVAHILVVGQVGALNVTLMYLVWTFELNDGI